MDDIACMSERPGQSAVQCLWVRGGLNLGTNMLVSGTAVQHHEKRKRLKLFPCPGSTYFLKKI